VYKIKNIMILRYVVSFLRINNSSVVTKQSSVKNRIIQCYSSSTAVAKQIKDAENKDDEIKVENNDEYEGETDPFLRTEIKKYNLGKRWLARMMGEDPETFTQQDIDNAIQYLLPSHLFAKDARPMLKHPYEIFPKRKASEFDQYGRPFSASFYTGKPKYYDLTYKIWDVMEQLKLNKQAIEVETINPSTLDSNSSTSSVQIKQWMKKFQLEELLNEKINDKLYDTIIFRLKKLSNEERANEFQHFLSEFQVPVYTPGKEDLKDVELYNGVARSMGYRKTAIAEVIVREGSGKITVNNRSLTDYFKLRNDREQIMYPLLLINELDRYDIEVHVIGGGTSGKSGAIRLGMSRAIATLSTEHFEVLNKAGLLIRDSREKERKKPGRKRARRAFQWVKR